jgi:hypothetical protein
LRPTTGVYFKTTSEKGVFAPKITKHQPESVHKYLFVTLERVVSKETGGDGVLRAPQKPGVEGTSEVGLGQVAKFNSQQGRRRVGRGDPPRHARGFSSEYLSRFIS